MSTGFSRLLRGSLRPTFILMGLLALSTLFGAPSPASAHPNHPLSSAGFIQLIAQASQANLRGAFLYINNPQLNGSSLAILEVTQNWNPFGLGDVYNNHPIGMWYDPTFGEWTIFNEDGAPIPMGAAFNVIGAANPNFASQLGGFFYQSSATNATYDFSDLNDSMSNGNPNALVLVTET